MSGLVAGFARRLRKLAATTQGEKTLGFEAPDGKHT